MLDSAVSMVVDDLREVEIQLKGLLSSSVAIIPQVGGHLTFAGGKRLRPMLALLCARAAGYRADHRITIAAVGELLHTATLLHDDVIDRGEFRRGRPAARLPYGNGMSVLTGDFCLARGLQAVAETGQLVAVKTLADTVTSMAEGEIAQLHSAGDCSLDRKRYQMIIRRKTAALLAWCSSLAGLLGAERSAALYAYGLELGCAFQIADDVLDYRADHRLGKARGQDLREGKATLPLILACERDRALQRAHEALLGAGPPVDEAALRQINLAVSNSGALEDARKCASSHASRAATHLHLLPTSPARDALAMLADYVVDRRS
ncbi:MAG: polyprenyl synthetase family protein [Nannocystaceae bacterium]